MSILVPIGHVHPDPKQPRTYFSKAALTALAKSISKAGQRRPITVRKLQAGSFEIIDGERRWRASALAGLTHVRVDIEENDVYSPAGQHLLSLISNFMREGHTHMEISNAVQYQVSALIEAGMTRGQAIVEVSESIGKSDAWVYQYLQLQLLRSDLQVLMHPEVPDNTRLRFAEAVVLAVLPTAQQKSIYRALLPYPPGARAQKAKSLAAEATGVPIQRRSKHIKRTTSRFVYRISTEIERVLDYKQSEFRTAFAEVPLVDRKAFRASVSMLLTEIDASMPKGRANG